MKELRHPLPIRIWHWLFAPAMIMGTITGLSHSFPNFSPGFPNLRSLKKAHFTAGFIMAGLYTLYLFDRRKYPDIIPTPADLLSGAPKLLAYELFLTDKKPKFRKYNPFQKILYTLWLLLIPFILIMGVLLYWPRRLARVIAWMGGLNNIRRLKHLAVVLMAWSLSVHTYFALTGSLEVLQSIFTGTFSRKKM